MNHPPKGTGAVSPVSHIELDSDGTPILTAAFEAELAAAQADIDRGNFVSLDEALALIRSA